VHTIRLGLIGDNIADSKAPLLHEFAGQLHGRDVTYQRLVPRKLGLTAQELLLFCREHDFYGVNVTYPYKQLLAKEVTITDESVKALGAINTVLFEPGGPQGFNTDYSGFIAAYCATLGLNPPRSSCILGTGGVGSAIAFALVQLGARTLCLFDKDTERAHTLEQALKRKAPNVEVRVTDNIQAAIDGAEGVLNCTPVGMVGVEGEALVGTDQLRNAKWAFDAVYTPERTTFMENARAARLATLSGFELFFFQGVHAFRHFTGIDLEQADFRNKLREVMRNGAS
jgi:shikimate dehydrogenase